MGYLVVYSLYASCISGMCFDLTPMGKRVYFKNVFHSSKGGFVERGLSALVSTGSGVVKPGRVDNLWAHTRPTFPGAGRPAPPL